MGEKTGIAWTDSTFNSWWGCTRVGPACDDCYAEVVDKRTGESHWGHGAPRRLLSEHARNEPYRWQKQADKFEAEHGHRRRVFTLSMGDLFDNEVPEDWRAEHMHTMQVCNRLEWQICTKRVSNLPKMVPPIWMPTMVDGPRWPRHVGVLITIVTQAEADRDVPRLLECKRRFGIPWVGISYEPAQELVDWGLYAQELDWIIFGGKSGAKWNDRPFSLDWARQTRDQCAEAGTAFFMKQVAAFRPTDHMIPADLMIRQFPAKLS
jgi:protein gp37